MFVDAQAARRLFAVVLALGSVVCSSSAHAQANCNGQGTLGFFCGVASGSNPALVSGPSLFAQAFGTTAGTVLNRTSVWGATSQPTLGANGGTGGAITLNGATSGSVTLGAKAVAGTGTIFNFPTTNGATNNVLITDGSGNTSWVSAGSGTVSSVSLSLPGIFNVTVPTVTTTGTLTAVLNTQTANQVWASSPTVGPATPAFRALVGADLPNPSASTLGGVESFAAVGSQWIRQISTSGVPTASQPAFTDISGVVSASQLPNPTASTLGGIESLVATSHQWIYTISTSGVPASSQPAFTDISGQTTLAQLPGIGSNTILSNIAGGTSTPLANSLSAIIDSSIASTQGDVLYRNGSVWTALPPATAGQVLTTGGAGANPSWTTVTGTGTVTNIATNNGVTGGPITNTGTIGLATFATGNVLANVSGGTTFPTPTTPSAVLDVIGSTEGSVLYRGLSTWAALTPGTSGQGLITGGAGSTPSWGNVVSSITAGAGLTGGTITTTGTVAIDFTRNDTWTGIQSFQNDAWFSSGDPYCNVVAKGAVHNGSTDDSGAFQACVTQCLTTRATGACTVFVPPQSSIYCIKSTVNFNTGLTYNGGIILIGGGVQGTVISACGTNTNLFYMNNQWVQIKQMTIYGYGSFASDAIFTGTPVTQPAILLGSGCSQCRIQDVYVIGGTAAIQNNGSCGYVLDNVWASNSYGDGVHILGHFSEISCGGTIWNSHMDQAYPVSQPAHGISVAAWTNGRFYSTGTIVTVTCISRTWYVQANSTGISGGSSPPCQPYGTNMTDGVVLWKLVSYSSSSCIQLDSGASGPGSVETEIIQTDMTCSSDANLLISDTYGGGHPPSQISVIRSTPGGALSQNVLISGAATHLTFVGLETSYCALTGCAGFYISGNASTVNVLGMDCFNGVTYCVLLGGVTNNVSINNLMATGADTADFEVTAASTGFRLANSNHVSGSANMFTVTAVAADHYLIQNNICNGTGASDSGSGAHKSVQSCTGTNP